MTTASSIATFNSHEDVTAYFMCLDSTVDTHNNTCDNDQALLI